MTVLLFAAPRRGSRGVPGTARAPMAPARGSFGSPSGGTGSFRGVYRLERLLARPGSVAVSGVFSGELVDERGGRVGIAARRRTTPAELSAGDGTLLVRIAALDVDLNGFVVAVEGLVVDVRGTSGERPVRAALRLPPETPVRRDAAGVLS